MEGSIEKTVAITNRRGLHARAAAKFVRLAEGSGCSVRVFKEEGMDVCGASIMGLLMLGAGCDSKITIRVSGPQAQETLDALVALVERRFDEE